MFRLAREIVERGERALTTTTTHIFAAQIALAPASRQRDRSHARDDCGGAGRPPARARHRRHRRRLRQSRRRLAGSVRRLRAWCPGVCLLNEADGSRMRPFKAPADHEPAIPVETTLVVPVVGADVFGKPLERRARAPARAHQPAERRSTRDGHHAPRSWRGFWLTPTVAQERARGARVVALINKVEALADREPARATAERLLRESAIESVVLASVRADKPVLELCTR